MEENDLVKLLTHALKSPAGFGDRISVLRTGQLQAVAAFANGDARIALNTLEMAVLNGAIDSSGVVTVTDEGMSQCISRKSHSL